MRETCLSHVSYATLNVTTTYVLKRQAVLSLSTHSAQGLLSSTHHPASQSLVLIGLGLDWVGNSRVEKKSLYRIEAYNESDQDMKSAKAKSVTQSNRYPWRQGDRNSRRLLWDQNCRKFKSSGVRAKGRFMREAEKHELKVSNLVRSIHDLLGLKMSIDDDHDC